MGEKKQLDEQARAARAAYFREWRRRNPDKVRAANRKYWERRAQRMQESAGETGAKGGTK